MPTLYFTDKEWKIHLESVDDLEQDYLKKHIVKEDSVEYQLVYQKPKGYGYWYILDTFNDIKSALSAYAKHILNITHAYKLIKVFYITIHSSEDKI